METEQERKLWECMSGEPLLWYRRFMRYRLMEPVRSVAALFQEEETEKNREKPRTKPTGDWYEMAKQWKWEERALAWDTYQDRLLEQQIEREKKRVVRTRYALMHKRVQKLDQLVQQLLDYTKEESKIWLLDVKAIGNGPEAERVDLMQFNDALFREIRAHFADIASELGERVKKTNTTLTVTPKTYVDLDLDEDGSEE